MKAFIKTMLQIPVGRLLGWPIWLLAKAAIGLLGFATWVQVRTSGIGQVPDLVGKAARDPWFWVILSATYFAAWNPGSWLIRLSQERRQGEQRSNYLVMGLLLIRKSIKLLADNHFVKAREQILLAAALELHEALGLTDHTLIKTNLLIVAPNDAVQVVARSRPGSPEGAIYPHDNRMAVTQAMTKNATVVVSGVRTLPGYDGKPYDCVVATPVTDGAKAFGALTADSPDKNTFRGKEATIDRVFRPYAALLLLTLPKDSASCKCPETYH